MRADACRYGVFGNGAGDEFGMGDRKIGWAREGRRKTMSGQSSPKGGDIGDGEFAYQRHLQGRLM